MNQNVINIQVTAKDMASSVLKGVGDTAKSLASPFKMAGNAAKGLFNILNTLPGILGAVGLVGAFNDSIEAAKNFESAMITLEIIAPRFGVAADEAKDAAQRLGKELKIGVGASAASLQNLLKSGLNLEQATELIKRFTNEAMTGKSPTISLAQAVENLSFAYATGNSALGNMSGISENFQDIIDRGRKSLEKEGVAVQNITDDMAKFRGMMDLTNLTLGSSDKFLGTLTDTQAQLSFRAEELRVKIGQFLAPILNNLLRQFLDLSDRLAPFTEGIFELASGIKLFITSGDQANDLLWNFAQRVGVTKNQFDAFVAIVEQAKVGVNTLFEAFMSQAPNIENLLKNIQASLVPIVESTVEFAQTMVKEVGDVIARIMPELIGLWESLWPAINNVLDVLSPVVTNLIDLGERILPVLEPLFSAAFRFGLDVLKEVVQFLGETIRLTKEAVAWLDKVIGLNQVANNTEAQNAAASEIANRDKLATAKVRSFKAANPTLAGQANSLADIIRLQKSGIPINAFAKGGEFITKKPQLIMVGDNPGAREHVEVTPLSSNQNRSSSNQSMNFTINNYGNQLSETMLAAKFAFLINGA